jgi:HAE1 family hydrophobic/amphiphilic exporter-1
VNPVEASVARPYTVAVAVILAMVFSWLAFERIPIQLKPTVDTPRITVTTGFRGASAIEVEEQITRELEEELQRVEGLTKMFSESTEGRSVVTLEFAFGTDTSLAVVDAINKLSRISRLPEEADEPRIDIVSEAGTQAIMWIAVRSSYEPNRVRRIVDDEVEARISRVSGIAGLILAGGSEREVQVRVDPERLVGHGVTYGELSRSLTAANLNIRGGTIETAKRQWVVRTVGRAEVPARIQDVVVKETPGGRVLLGDVATVVDDYAEIADTVNINGRPGVAMGVQRKTGANVVSAIRGVDAALADMNEGFRDRGIDVELVPVYRETEYIDQALEFVTENLVWGTLLSVIALLVFLRSWRSVLIISLSIPICLATVFPVMQALGRTINVISLAGLAFASGMVVDNATVVLENIYQHLDRGKTLLRACVDGGREVWGGVLASTLTTVFVFIPVLLEGDEASQLFIDMAIVISASVLISLVVALTVVPVLSNLLLRGRRVPKAFSLEGTRRMPLGFVGRAYGRTMDALVSAWPGSLAAKVGLVLVVGALSAAAFRIRPSPEYLPSGNRNLIFFFAVPAPGTRVEAVRDNFRPLEDWVLAQPEAERMFVVNLPQFRGGGVALKRQHATRDGLAAFEGKMWAAAAACPGFLFVVPSRISIFQDPGKQFEIEISGPDFDALEHASQSMQATLRALPEVTAVRPSLITGRPELRVSLDEERAKELGLSVADVGTVIETAVAGRRLTTLIEGGREIDVNVVVPPERIRSVHDLETLPFVAPDGTSVVSLGAVAGVEAVTGPLSVRRLERQRNILLTVNITQDAPLSDVVQRVEEEIFPPIAASLGPAYALGFGGSADKLRTTLESLTGGFALSVLIVYLLLVALFRSWVSPFIILTTVPLAMAGGILGIRVAADLSGGHVAFDVLSMLGFIILAGIVVSNAILIVHQANNNVEYGMNPRTALAQSARSRLRPILLTQITTVTGLIPLALGSGPGSELYQGLAAIITGGLILSTVFTLFLTPILMSIGHDARGVPNDPGGATARPPASESAATDAAALPGDA